MNMKPINAVDALVAAYAIQAAAKIDGGMGAMGIKRTRGNTFNISDLQPKEREAVIGICLLYKAKQIKRSMAIDAISHYFSTDDQKTLARILNDGKKQWGGLVEFIENQSGEPPRFKERLNKI